MGLTKKEMETMRREMLSEIRMVYMTFGYSVQLLEDYRDDLKDEAKNTTKEIAKCRRKMKIIADKIIKSGHSVPTIKRM